jgi:hypothetical protein
MIIIIVLVSYSQKKYQKFISAESTVKDDKLTDEWSSCVLKDIVFISIGVLFITP